MEGEGRGQGLEWLKNFDVFPKTVDDAKEVSVSGGSVSVPLAYMYIMWSLPSILFCDVIFLAQLSTTRCKLNMCVRAFRCQSRYFSACSCCCAPRPRSFSLPTPNTKWRLIPCVVACCRSSFSLSRPPPPSPRPPPCVCVCVCVCVCLCVFM
jgi:hypothetical protein